MDKNKGKIKGDYFLFLKSLTPFMSVIYSNPFSMRLIASSKDLRKNMHELFAMRGFKMDFLFSSLITGLISVFTAFIILSLQEWRNKKRMLKAIYSEVESNSSLAEQILPLAEYLNKENKSKEYMGTFFDLQFLYNSSYEDFRRSGYLLSFCSMFPVHDNKLKYQRHQLFLNLSSQSPNTKTTKN